MNGQLRVGSFQAQMDDWAYPWLFYDLHFSSSRDPSVQYIAIGRKCETNVFGAEN